MPTDFAAAMRQALDCTRQQDVHGATAIVQRALGSNNANTDTMGRHQKAEAADGFVSAAGRIKPALQQIGQVQTVEPPFIRKPAGSFKSRRGFGNVMSGFRKATANGLADPLPAIGLKGRHQNPVIPAGAKFLARSYACASGTRGYRLYVPARLTGRPEGLILMLHGCTQNPEDFAVGTGMNELAERHRLLVAYPGQTAAHNLNACWNWFRPEDQRRDAGEPAILAGLAESVRAEFTIDPSRVFVAGLSAGGAMAAVLGMTYPEVFSAVGVHSGLPYRAAHDVPSAFAAMRSGAPKPVDRMSPRAGTPARTIVFHGSADQTVHPINAHQLIADSNRQTAQTVEFQETCQTAGRHCSTRHVTKTLDGSALAELWMVEGAGHAWAGGRGEGSYTDPRGPDASAEIVRFFINNE